MTYHEERLEKILRRLRRLENQVRAEQDKPNYLQVPGKLSDLRQELWQVHDEWMTMKDQTSLEIE